MATSVAAPLERQFGRIAGLTEMTSTSYLGSTSIALQFDLSRDINGAARDVQAAINAARGYLPPALPNNPSYRKVNPADAPIMIVALTSDTLGRGRMYDAASSILQQKLSQLPGVGQVIVGGSSLPGVRVEMNPTALNQYGIALETVRSGLAATTQNRPKGQLGDGARASEIAANDQLLKAAEYAPVIVAYRSGRPVQLSDVARVEDSVEDVRTTGLANGRPAVLLVIFRQPGANIIDTVDGVRGLLPELQTAIPRAITMSVVMDQTQTIRASLHDVELTLVISVLLVTLVVFAFLRSLRATLIPAVAVPVSLVATFGVMYVLGYSLDNLSLMALTIATGFVVDDAIVVLENVARHRARGLSPLEAALRGARRDRVHGAGHQPLAGGGVHADSLDERPGGPPLPGVRGDALRGDRDLAAGVAHHHSDDVRHAPRPGERWGARPALPGERAGLRLDAGPLRDEPLVGAAASPRSAGRDPPDHCPERLPVLGGAQGILSSARYGTAAGRQSRRRRTSRSRRCRPS
jgi:multidrug efflux pump